MARAAVLKASFNGGVISPRLFGRSDIAKYETAAETIENFIPRPEGGLIRRPGSRYVHPLRDQTERARLIGFQFSAIQNYLTIWNDGKLRFIKDRALLTLTGQGIAGITNASPGVLTYTGSDTYANGDRVVVSGVLGMTEVNNREFTVAGVNVGAKTFQLSGINTTSYGAYSSGGTVAEIYEIDQPYTEAQVPDLVTAQSADTMWVSHPSVAPRELTRSAHTSWTLSTKSFTQGPFGPINTNSNARIRCVATSGILSPGATGCDIYSNTDIFTNAHVGSLFYVREIYFNGDNTTLIRPWQPATSSSVGDLVRYGNNVYQAVATGAGGQTGQTAPTHTSGDAWDGLSNDRILWRYLHSGWAVLQITSFSTSKHVNATLLTQLPESMNQSPRTVNGAISSGGLIQLQTSAVHGYSTGDWVEIAGVGGTVEANGYWQITVVDTTHFTLNGSTFVNAYASTGSSRRFATWLYAFGAFSDARGYPACVSLHEQRLFWANTTAQPTSVWGSRAGDYSFYMPENTNDDDPIAYTIASGRVDPVRWLVSGNDLLLGTLAGERAGFGGGLGDPMTPTNTRVVPQSGEGSSDVQPVAIGTETVFVNRAQRKIFAMVFDGSVGSYVADELTKLADHFFVGRTIVKIVWAKNPCSLLWVLLDNGTLLSLTFSRKDQVFAWAKQPINGTVEDVEVIPSTDGTVDDVWMVVNRTINGGTKRYIEYIDEPFEPVSATDKSSMGYVDGALKYSGSSATVISGLFHLEGQEVRVVADGALQLNKTVSAGKITLDAAATNVYVGLPYTSVVRPLRIEPAGSGLAGTTKRVSRLGVRVLNAMSGFAGPDAAGATEEIVRRDLSDPMDASSPLQSGDFDVDLPSDYDTKGQFTVVQSDPLPLDILCFIANTTAEAA